MSLKSEKYINYKLSKILTLNSSFPYQESMTNIFTVFTSSRGQIRVLHIVAI